MPTHESPTLARRLGLSTAVMVVIGSTIGSGIFLTPQNVAHAVPVPGLMILVWAFMGHNESRQNFFRAVIAWVVIVAAVSGAIIWFNLWPLIEKQLLLWLR